MNRTTPTRAEATIFRLKAACLQLRRSVDDLITPGISRWKSQPRGELTHCWAEMRSPLHADPALEQRDLVLGKIENLRVAVKSLHGVEVPAAGTFSFWRQIGRATAGRGYVHGRELREGCIIPAIGGGICQLSNALYQAASEAGLEIVERHVHSQVVPGSAAEAGRDATVFWNYIDLRFRDTQAFRIEAELDRTHLIVRIFKQQARKNVLSLTPAMPVIAVAGTVPNSCDRCDARSCFRRVDLPEPPAGMRTAFLLDGMWPEFDRWVQAVRGAHDSLFIPLDGKARNKPQYGWTTAGFAQVRTFPVFTVWRALASRKLAHQGAARQQSALLFRARLARLYASRIDFRTEHIVVAQELLPFLWQLGVLQGRSFDVLMTGLSLHDMQAQLDAAFARHPTSRTLADFRANDALPELEREALRHSRQIVTPHAMVARNYKNVVLLPWLAPAASAQAAGTRIVFPASTLGRKGAFELREAALSLGLRLTLTGPDLEAPQFWDGVDVERLEHADAHGLTHAAVLVLPAWVENRPLRLLQALQCGIPVIASDACGLPAQANLTVVPSGDIAALVAALRPFANTACAAV